MQKRENNVQRRISSTTNNKTSTSAAAQNKQKRESSTNVAPKVLVGANKPSSFDSGKNRTNLAGAAAKANDEKRRADLNSSAGKNVSEWQHSPSPKHNKGFSIGEVGELDDQQQAEEEYINSASVTQRENSVTITTDPRNSLKKPSTTFQDTHSIVSKVQTREERGPRMKRKSRKSMLNVAQTANRLSQMVKKKKTWKGKGQNFRQNKYFDQQVDDLGEILNRQNEISMGALQKANEILPDKTEHVFFENTGKQVEIDIERTHENGINIQNIMDASQDIRQSEAPDVIKMQVNAGEKSYSREEFEISHEITMEQIVKDLKCSQISKNLLKIIQDPHAVKYWNQTQFEQYFAGEEKLRKQRVEDRKQRKLAKLEALKNQKQEVEWTPSALDITDLKNNNHGNIQEKQKEALQADQNLVISENESDDSDSSRFDSTDSEEELEIFGDGEVLRQIAEYKARATGQLSIAQQIRNLELDNQQVLEFLEKNEDSDNMSALSGPLGTFDVNDQSQIVLKGLGLYNEEERKSELVDKQKQMLDKDSLIEESYLEEAANSSQVEKSEKSKQKRLKQSLNQTYQGENINRKTQSRGPAKQVHQSKDRLTESSSLLTEQERKKQLEEQSHKEELKTFITNLSEKFGFGVNGDVGLSKGITGRLEDDLIDSGRSKNVQNAQEVAEISPQLKPKDAVMKLVENIDSTAVRAEHMKLTHIGFIDVLKQVTQKKYLQLRAAKKEFEKRVDTVVRAKNYELKCQRIIAISAARRVVTHTIAASKDLFNDEVAALKQQYRRMLDLCGFFETIVTQQAGVIAVQEKVISKLQNRLFGQMADKFAHKKAIEEVTEDPQTSQEVLDEKYDKMQKNLYRFEPFEFYGGKFFCSIDDRQTMMRDQIYLKQEIQIDTLKDKIGNLESQVQELLWLNGINEQKYAETLDLLIKQRKKNERQRMDNAAEVNTMRDENQKQLEDIKRIIDDKIEEYEQFRQLAHQEVLVHESITKALQDRIEMYKLTQMQAKAVLRIPRLCQKYHAKIKGLTEQESNLLLEDLYNQLYASRAEQRELQLQNASKNSKNNQKIEVPKLSKVEEGLIDRSVRASIDSQTDRSNNARSKTNNPVVMIRHKSQKKEAEMLRKSIKSNDSKSPASNKSTNIQFNNNFNEQKPFSSTGYSQQTNSQQRNQEPSHQRTTTYQMLNQDENEGSSHLWAVRTGGFRKSTNLKNAVIHPLYNQQFKPPNTSGGNAEYNPRRQAGAIVGYVGQDYHRLTRDDNNDDDMLQGKPNDRNVNINNASWQVKRRVQHSSIGHENDSVFMSMPWQARRISSPQDHLNLQSPSNKSSSMPRTSQMVNFNRKMAQTGQIPRTAEQNQRKQYTTLPVSPAANISTRDWRKSNLIKRAQITINDIHEKALAQKRGFARLVASAGGGGSSSNQVTTPNATITAPQQLMMGPTSSTRNSQKNAIKRSGHEEEKNDNSKSTQQKQGIGQGNMRHRTNLDLNVRNSHGISIQTRRQNQSQFGENDDVRESSEGQDPFQQRYPVEKSLIIDSIHEQNQMQYNINDDVDHSSFPSRHLDRRGQPIIPPNHPTTQQRYSQRANSLKQSLIGAIPQPKYDFNLRYASIDENEARSSKFNKGRFRQPNNLNLTNHPSSSQHNHQKGGVGNRNSQHHVNSVQYSQQQMMESDFMTEEDLLRVESMERRKMRRRIPSYQMFKGNISGSFADRTDPTQEHHQSNIRQSNVVDHKENQLLVNTSSAGEQPVLCKNQDIAVVNEFNKFNSIGQGSLATTGQTGSIFMPNSSLNQGSSVAKNNPQNASLYETQGFETSRDQQNQRTRDSLRFQQNFASPAGDPRVIQTSRNVPFSNEKLMQQGTTDSIHLQSNLEEEEQQEIGDSVNKVMTVSIKDSSFMR